MTTYDDDTLQQIGSAAIMAEKFRGDGTGVETARSVLASLESRDALGGPGEVTSLRAEVSRANERHRDALHAVAWLIADAVGVKPSDPDALNGPMGALEYIEWVTAPYGDMGKLAAEVSRLRSLLDTYRERLEANVEARENALKGEPPGGFRYAMSGQVDGLQVALQVLSELYPIRHEGALS